MTSSRFEELEKRCARLKKIRIIRLVSSLAFLFLGAFGIYYWLNHTHQGINETTSTSVPEVNVSIPLLSDINETTTPRVEVIPISQMKTSSETLFLAPHVYKDKTKLPSAELEEAKRSLNEEQHLIKVFQAEQNFSNAYALAHFYFERKSYSEVILWTKEASKRDSHSDLPWILYAKAKFYLGDRAEAIRSLELFLGYINSKEAQELLNFYKGQE
ncbi:CDC27 family protein [Sulfurospirillum diekertiae]|uniref:CDC27 family protein n=1 Tax=Sulfurospirillum diekertiae TaxID=1854492 RepID=A0A6G9VPU1_9BACT|nr:CDC27 family protein [Sulfurospirillum diekertiae]QIR74949.1 CDC27 family protein [Sulfurospirillum diekertiae]QIR77613.1 CDC27 family protein [Sulfurospirillum diekertiae]